MKISVPPVTDKHLRKVGEDMLQDREESITEKLEKLVYVMSRTCILYTEDSH